ncbi:hypothetical protein ACLB2K_015754 [Fragaria x ananassa]
MTDADGGVVVADEGIVAVVMTGSDERLREGGGVGGAGGEARSTVEMIRGDTGTTGGEVGCAGGASGGRDWETETVGIVDEEESSRASEVAIGPWINVGCLLGSWACGRTT